MSKQSEICEVTFTSGDWSYPIYFSRNSAGYWETYHVADYTDPKGTLTDAIERFKKYLISEWNRPNLDIASSEPKTVPSETAAQNGPAQLDQRSAGAFRRPPRA